MLEEPLELVSSGRAVTRAKTREPMATTTEMISVMAISPNLGMGRIL